MRDIRNDLQERATLIDEQIRATCAHFEKIPQQLQSEQDAKIADLKSGLAMVTKFMEFEQRFLGTVSPPVGRLLDFGTVTINGAGTTHAPIRAILAGQAVSLAVGGRWYADTARTAPVGARVRRYIPIPGR